MKRTALIALATLAFCTAALPASAGQSRETRIGQTARVDGLRIRPIRILEDSRCPMNARCVWAGRITVRVEITGRGRRITRDLSLGNEITFQGGKLMLSSAEPGRMAGGPALPPARYRFTFSYER